MSASDSRPEQEIADLAQMLPVSAERDLATDRHLLLKEHLMAEIQAAHPGFRPVRWPSVRRGTLALAAGATVLAITVTASALGTAARSGGTGSGATGPSGLLHQIAAAAGRAHARPPRPKQFAYLVNYVADGHGKLHEKQIWIPVSNLCDGLTIMENGTGSGSGCATGPGPSRPDLGTLTAYPTYKLLRSLPTRPAALLAKILAATKKSGHQNLRVMLTISNVLINSIAPPKFNAALYRVAANIPGLRVVRHATDPLGRPGVGVTFSSDGTRIEWIFNSKTLHLLGERLTFAKDSKKDGQFAARGRAFVSHSD
ncbi:MAG TPA: CU044_5270 family protein [Streptosporangiaceae bacterium]